eukprot:CAMPEP_0119357748 /NCGR_PEP_ID=MMETSP1334-20130426/6077_1 /TAXON_ID=127549 /ORGANISM="Calcidiscus leptoporus, Strain RCC1130" /LENGTH=65 /DNA_ID=CAMNT_0007372059 /DNA_START=40 /DNA_END=237 /DNA_ORIENTATION=-
MSNEAYTTLLAWSASFVTAYARVGENVSNSERWALHVGHWPLMTQHQLGLGARVIERACAAARGP